MRWPPSTSPVPIFTASGTTRFHQATVQIQRLIPDNLLGGLASACVAAARGHAVTLYDKNAWLGGKTAVLHERGFRFDMGPTILTVPRVLERIFAEAGRDLHAY